MIECVDLSGVWELGLDYEASGNRPGYDDEMFLPGTTSNSRKGRPNDARETGFLTDTYKFEGHAWFRRKVELTNKGASRLELFLERTRITTVYIDGKKLGTQYSFVSPHVYDLTEYIGTGRHELEVCVANVGYKTGGGHMTSQDTQTNWNGITGAIQLRYYGKASAKELRIDTDITAKTLHITGDICGIDNGLVRVSAELFNVPGNSRPEPKEYVFSGGKLDLVYKMGQDALLWSEHQPALYKVLVDVEGDVSEHIIGLRSFSTKEGKFTINGEKTFLRGKHDGMIFPKTGYAPCTTDEWLRVMGIARSFGINHYRFHTCCPPEAAFIAADMLGIYMEPQLPFWGTIAAPGEEGYNEEEQSFLISEGFAMLREFGDHPSFCMMSMGNELWGSKERINEIIGMYKSIDKRHLYTQGSNNFQWFPNVVENDDFFVGVRLANDRLIRGSYAMCDAPLGHVQTERPGTRHSYDSVIRPEKKASSTETSEDGTVQIQFGTTMKTVKASDADADFIPDIPIVTHEIGQYETFPDFNEIEKYTGSIKARNFEVFKERLEARGLGRLGHDFFKCSGELALACYKEELEAVFRSRLLAGFQILDIQDFSGQGTALVGMLDAFMDNKGIVTPDEWRRFCNDAVLLAEFDSYTVMGGSEFSADIKLTDFRPGGMNGRTLSWRLLDEYGKAIGSGSEPINETGNYTDICSVSALLPDLGKVYRVILHISIDGTDVENMYELEVLPKVETVDLEGVYIFREVNDEASKLLDDGKTVLIVPELETLSDSLPGFYCQDFWCYPMFSSISRMMGKPEPVGTMGLVIDKHHPALKGFASRGHSTPVWWDIVENSRCEILDGREGHRDVIVRMIDNFDRNHDLAILYEYEKAAGRVLVCNCDLEKLSETPAGRVFIRSVFDYARN